MRRWLIAGLLLAGLVLCYAYDQWLYRECRASGKRHAVCLAEQGDL